MRAPAFIPLAKLTLNVTENYTSNLNGYLAQSLSSNGTLEPGLSLGSGAHSSTLGGGATYQFTNYLMASAQATYYEQTYFGKSYTGTYLSGTVSYGKRLLDMFTFSGSIVDSNNGQGTNSVGFVGNVNFFRSIKGWQISGVFSYAQNVQSLLVTYTTSYYNYNANLHRRLPAGLQWTAAFNGTHSGLTNYAGTQQPQRRLFHFAELAAVERSTATTPKRLGSRCWARADSCPFPTPGLNDFIYLRRFELRWRHLSHTDAAACHRRQFQPRDQQHDRQKRYSHNNTEIFNAQMQYHLRRIGLHAGYTRFTPGNQRGGRAGKYHGVLCRNIQMVRLLLGHGAGRLFIRNCLWPG